MKTLLIANRGEIAIRVARSARTLGIRTVALFTDLDEHAPHVRAADQAVHVASYLDIDAVVAAARAVGAEAVHPGYGFLSERAPFARAVQAAGITLVGPSAEVMDAMGRKDAAREIAVEAGVPVVPSYDRDTPPAEMAFPVLVKAAAGGGGKGMRIVRSADEYDEAVAAARREASSAFGDDTMLVEKYVERGRHVEVQIIADAHGSVVHLFERDCSAQRRHQKVLEEAPAPDLPEGVRDRVTGAAVALARQVGYVNAGTVEFLLDTVTGEAYFLEMNTRLQVEHPVTELAVTVRGEHPDLVALQLLVADGEPLPFGQDDVALAGHAIEARVYAEDAYGGFLPQAGTASFVHWPTSVDSLGTVRVDAALESGQRVSTAYDPMLGKVIAAGPDRDHARRALVAALDRTAVLGLTTNTGFLRALADSRAFAAGAVDTAWLDRIDLAAEVPPPDPDRARVVAAWVRAAEVATDTGHPFASDGFRLGAEPAPVRVELDRVVHVDRHRRTVDDTPVTEVATAPHEVQLEVADERVRGFVEVRPHEVEVVHRGQRHAFRRPDPFLDAGPALGDGTLTAPMPGTVLAVSVLEGDHVREGQTVGVLEAMKMELAMKAPFDGVVTAVGATAGEQVAMGARLFVISAEDADA